MPDSDGRPKAIPLVELSNVRPRITLALQSHRGQGPEVLGAPCLGPLREGFEGGWIGPLRDHSREGLDERPLDDAIFNRIW